MTSQDQIDYYSINHSQILFDHNHAQPEKYSQSSLDSVWSLIDERRFDSIEVNVCLCYQYDPRYSSTPEYKMAIAVCQYFMRTHKIRVGTITPKIYECAEYATDFDRNCESVLFRVYR